MRIVAHYVRQIGLFAGELEARIVATIRDVSAASGIPWTVVIGTTKRASVTRARRAVAAALRAIDLGDGRHMSLTEIGLLMGGKDHSTVCYYLGRRASYVPVAERRRVAAEMEAAGRRSA